MKEFIKGFGYAFNGIAKCLISERNMRVHFCFLGYMIFFLKRFDFFEVSRVEFAVLLLSAALVIVAEYINTAVERAVDTATNGEHSQTAKIAKDAAAGAVLIAALFAVAVGLMIMLQPEAFKKLFEFYSEHLLRFAVLAVSIVSAVAFVFVNPSVYIKKLRRKNK